MSVRALAAEVGIGFDTITAFENGRRTRESTKAKIMALLETQGIEIFDGDAPGARLWPRKADADGS